MHRADKIVELEALLKKAMAITIQLKEELPSTSSGRNPAHFVDIERSNHLSEAGIQTVYTLFERGHSCEEVAQVIGISVRGAQNRYNIWKAGG
ncbi:hypothetical protein [Polycladidibacter hongkongensis]|uniref:hypothetical protein n=1 Tax=Polycladidibacter hongkongensis TaxID=1647556 RepID=UPI000834EF99|nr:hypothetical protein [Pseudovibrio hongkongensis]